MDLPFRIPGTSEPEIIVRRSGVRRSHACWSTAYRSRAQRGRYPITLPDGSVKELRLTGQWSGLKAVVDGVETPLEPQIPRYLLVPAFLPIGLVAVGGLIGGAFGGLGVAINMGVLRLQMASARQGARDARRDRSVGRPVRRRGDRLPKCHRAGPDARRRDVRQRCHRGQRDRADRSRVLQHAARQRGRRDRDVPRVERVSRSGDARDVRGTGLHRGVQHIRRARLSRARASTCCRSCRRMRPGPRATARSPVSCWPGTAAS